MWETPFEESMLSAQPGVAIYCEDDKAAEELFEVFKQNEIGKHWNAVVGCNGELNLLLRALIHIAIL